MENVLKKVNEYAELIKIIQILIIGCILSLQLSSIKKEVVYISGPDLEQLEQTQAEINESIKKNKYYSCVTASKLDTVMVDYQECINIKNN